MCMHSFLVEIVYSKVAIPLLRKETDTSVLFILAPLVKFGLENLLLILMYVLLFHF